MLVSKIRKIIFNIINIFIKKVSQDHALKRADLGLKVIQAAQIDQYQDPFVQNKTDIDTVSTSIKGNESSIAPKSEENKSAVDKEEIFLGENSIEEISEEELCQRLLLEIRTMKLGWHKGKQTKNKPLLLLTVLNLLDSEEIKQNEIYLSPSLEEEFNRLAHMVKSKEEAIRICSPFYYLVNSTFWRHKVIDGNEENYRLLSLAFINKSQLNRTIKYAYILDAYYPLFVDISTRQIIRETILRSFFNDFEIANLVSEKEHSIEPSETFTVEDLLPEVYRVDDNSPERANNSHSDQVLPQSQEVVASEERNDGQSLDEEKSQIDPEIEEQDKVDLSQDQPVVEEDITEKDSIRDDSQPGNLEQLFTPSEDVAEDYEEVATKDQRDENQFANQENEDSVIEQEKDVDPINENISEPIIPVIDSVIVLEPVAFQKKKIEPSSKEHPGKTKRRSKFIYGLKDIPKINRNEIDEFLDIAEMHSLESFVASDIQKLENHLLNAFERFEIIGELPLSQENFDYLCRLIQKRYIFHQKFKIDHVPPAFFVMTMVFCARYSEEDARRFWEPYAKRVWNVDSTQYFQLKCREHFIDCRRYLAEKFGFDFFVKQEGEVVRPVYYQAEIPYYLQSSFAKWLVDQFEVLLKYSVKDLPAILQEETSLDYVPKRLKDFIRQEETKDIAALLIQEMAKAVKLFQVTEQFETVKSVMNSPIQQSLWVEIYEQLIRRDIELSKVREYSAKAYWGWDAGSSEFHLRLSHIRSSRKEKPILLIWAEKGAKSLRKQEIIEDIYPFELGNGDWEIEPITLRKWGDFDGEIYILSEDFDLEVSADSQQEHVIYQKPVPVLSQPLVFFEAKLNDSFAKGKERIDRDGDWIVISKNPIDVIDSNGESLQFESQYLPELLTHYGYSTIRKYAIHLPITIRMNEQDFSFKVPETATVLQHQIIGQEPLDGLSSNVPPIFRSPQVKIIFNGIFPQPELSKIWLSVQKGTAFVKSISLFELFKQNLLQQTGNSFAINLKGFLETPGAYSFNLLHNLQSLIEEPINFSYLPGFDCEGPDPDIVYSPINPVDISISGIDCDQIKPYQEDKVKMIEAENKVILRWKELKHSECRFSIQWDGNNILLCWPINRVSAWIDGEGGKKEVVEEDVPRIILHARGKPYEPLSWIVVNNGKRRNIQLDARGEFNEPLEHSVLRDMLKQTEYAISTVRAELRGMSWEVFAFKKKSIIEIRSVNLEGSKIIIELKQSEILLGEYTVQVTSKDQTRLPTIISDKQPLPNKIEANIDIVPGKYQIEILLYNELIATSSVFEKEDKRKPTVSDVHPIDLLLTQSKFSSKTLFDNLTISPAEAKGFCTGKLDKTYIPHIEQIICNQNTNLWINDEKLSDGLIQLLPSWAVLDFPLRFTTKELANVFYIYPQQLAFGHKFGKGYVRIKIGGQPMDLYAAWNSDKDLGYVNLWLMFPQQEKIRDFSELDERDMWSAYQCVDCGLVVGSREGSYIKLPPNIVMQHSHINNKPVRDQFRDVVYGKHMQGIMSQYKERQLIHTRDPHISIGLNFLQDLINGRVQPIRGEITKPISLNNPTAYYCAISELVENYRKLVLNTSIKQIMGEVELFYKINEYILHKREIIPAFCAMGRLYKELKVHDQIDNLPKYALLLALILRLKGHLPGEYWRFVSDTDVSEDILMDITSQTYSSCPKLLEWAIATADLFFIHAIS